MTCLTTFNQEFRKYLFQDLKMSNKHVFEAVKNLNPSHVADVRVKYGADRFEVHFKDHPWSLIIPPEIYSLHPTKKVTYRTH